MTASCLGPQLFELGALFWFEHLYGDQRNAPVLWIEPGQHCHRCKGTDAYRQNETSGSRATNTRNDPSLRRRPSEFAKGFAHTSPLDMEKLGSAESMVYLA